MTADAAEHGLSLAAALDATVHVLSVVDETSLGLDVRSTISGQEREQAATDAVDDPLDVGGRIVTLERHFNNQRGFDRGDDRLPYEDELPGFEAALDDYYDARGWDDDGTAFVFS